MPSPMTSPISRGLISGAVGTTALLAVTYADMALTGRAASRAPEESVATLLRRSARPVPSDNALTGLGALAGIATGVGIGVVASLLRSAGVRLPAAVGAPAIGALAMAATDVSIARLGVSGPRTWTAADWTRDVVPHLAYGIGVRATMDRLDRVNPGPMEGEESLEPSSLRTRNVLGRSLLIGLASGGRSSLGLFAAARLTEKPKVTAGAAAAVAAEMVADKLPTTPERLEPAPLLGRAAGGGIGGWAVARQQGANPVLPTAVGVLGAVAGSVLGAAGRELASNRGWAWPGAVAEDAISVGLAWAALR
jgi:uncharacterized membrane protein